MDWGSILHRIISEYFTIGVVVGAYILPQKYVELLDKTYVVDLFQKVYIFIIGFVVVFVTSIIFALRDGDKGEYLVSQFIIFFLPFFAGLFRAFRRVKK
jgi:hypothetical protein